MFPVLITPLRRQYRSVAATEVKPAGGPRAGRTVKARMVVAILALAGFFISVYLTLFKLGIIGQVACGSGSCDIVNLSAWGSLFGIPVAAWGMAYYAALFSVAFAGVHDRWLEHPMVPRLLLLLAVCGIVFSVYLTYLELFVIHAICRWCVASALIVLAIFAVVVVDWRANSRR